MNIYSFDCPVSGRILVNSRGIEDLFSVYEVVYKEAFSLNLKTLKEMQDFKIRRGGVLIEIKNKEKILGLFTLSYGKSDNLELGDLLKLEREFPRESFAKAMKNACSHIVDKKRKKGVYIYPNPHAIKLEKMAGFREYSLYLRRVSFVLFNLTFLLPIEIYNQKIFLSRSFFKHSIVRTNLSVLPTRLTKFTLRIFRKATDLNESKKVKIMKFGLLYEFIPSETYGDPFLVFGQSDFNLNDIGFEFCDNSA